MRCTLKTPPIPRGVARWNWKAAGSYNSATTLTKECCQQGLPRLLLPNPCPASSRGSDAGTARLRHEAGQAAATAEDRFSRLMTPSLVFHQYISFPMGSLHSETINYTQSWVLRFRNLAKVDFHLSWSLQTSHASLLPLSTCLKAQCRQQFSETLPVPPLSEIHPYLFRTLFCTLGKTNPRIFRVSVYRLQNKCY